MESFNLIRFDSILFQITALLAACVPSAHWSLQRCVCVYVEDEKTNLPSEIVESTLPGTEHVFIAYSNKFAFLKAAS